MATVQQTQQQIRQGIAAAYPEPEAGAIAQLVLEHLLQKTRLQLSLAQQQEVPTELEEQVEQAIARLQQQEPVQYVLGTAYFYGLDLEVDARVLIPRPETEELVHLMLQEHKGQQGLQVLDICTGSGCIPLALKANLENAQVYGLEVSEGALQVARANARRYSLQVEWLLQDILEPVTGIAPASLDVITSNPPYVLEEERQLMRQNVLDYEPHLALFVPDHDPLKFYTRIAEVGAELLKPGGKLYFEINERYGQAVCQTLEAAGFAEARVVQDLFGKDRTVRAVR